MPVKKSSRKTSRNTKTRTRITKDNLKANFGLYAGEMLAKKIKDTYSPSLIDKIKMYLGLKRKPPLADFLLKIKGEFKKLKSN